MLTVEEKKKIIESVAKSNNDTGSLEVQIAVITSRIKQIAKHLELYPKDIHSRRGLIVLVGKRRRFARYLKENDEIGYQKIAGLL